MRREIHEKPYGGEMEENGEGKLWLRIMERQSNWYTRIWTTAFQLA
jgi:hypothetical protein